MAIKAAVDIALNFFTLPDRCGFARNRVGELRNLIELRSTKYVTPCQVRGHVRWRGVGSLWEGKEKHVCNRSDWIKTTNYSLEGICVRQGLAKDLVFEDGHA